jgi:hypothetical protein
VFAGRIPPFVAATSSGFLLYEMLNDSTLCACEETRIQCCQKLNHYFLGSFRNHDVARFGIVDSARHSALANQGVSRSLQGHQKSNRNKRAANGFHVEAGRHDDRHRTRITSRIKGWRDTAPLSGAAMCKRVESSYLTACGISVRTDLTRHRFVRSSLRMIRKLFKAPLSILL